VEILDFIRNTTKQLIQRKGGVKVKRILLITLFALLSVATFYGLSDAAVCSTCHTMHNSQDGSAENTDGPFERLLKAECVACHTGSQSSQVTSFDAPRVLSDDGNPGGQGNGETNAGGDFWWVKQPGNDELGHNVEDIGVGQDSIILSDTPPGWDPLATGGGFAGGQVAAGAANWGSQLSCAGTYGCHGDHDIVGSLAAMGGTHHNDGGSDYQAGTDGFADGSTLGDSYRFLYKIKGFENRDWNWNETTSLHNEYSGAPSPDNRDGNNTYANTDTISFLCAECHGIFHSDINLSSTGVNPWVRHPTDIVLPSTGEYSDYNNGGTTYSLTVPVARGGTPSSSSQTVTPGDTGVTGAIVMCLSCHRAHGSDYPDMLRFDYTAIDAGSGTNDTIGCFVCHTTKNAN
jgi:predicted CXXCH cytochrome family protein